MRFFVLKAAISPELVGKEIDLSPEEETCFNNNLGPYARNKKERSCLVKLYRFCNDNYIQLSSHLLFRFACCHNFDYRRAKKVISQNHDHPFFWLRMDERISEYMEQMIIYPLPGLRSKHEDSKVIFVRPSRYEPAPDSPELFFESLAYILNTMTITEEDSRNGITILTYLKGCEMKNYPEDPENTLVRLLDGSIIPIRITQILAMDANGMYSKVIKKKMAHPLMKKSLAEKIKVIKCKDLGDYLMDGYEEYLSDEIPRGWRSADEIVEDFCDERRYKERDLLSWRGSSVRF